MKLARGDSFMLKVHPASMPPGTMLDILDSDLRPFPQVLKDDDGNPYLIVPFRGEATFHVRARFGSTVQQGEATVAVEATSLNNRAETATRLCTLKQTVLPGTAAPGFLNGPLNWAKFGAVRLRNDGPGTVSIWLHPTVKPDNWGQTNQTHVVLGPGKEEEAYVGFAPRGDAPVGQQGLCDVVAEDDNGVPTGFTWQFEGIVGAPPQVAVTAPSWQVPAVQKVVGKDKVFAEFPIQLVNASPYRVALWRRWMQVTSGAAMGHDDWVQVVLPDSAIPPSIYFVEANATVNARIQFYYDLNLASPPPQTPRVMKHTITLFLLDPHLGVMGPYPESPPSDFGGYRTSPFSVEITLRLTAP
jgi:hypothetical protein